MKEIDSRNMSFAQLDELEGIPPLQPATEEEFPAPAWFRKVYHIPLNQLSTEDIARACRQRIHLDQIVSIALELLETDPLSGEMYDGELFSSVMTIPIKYWEKNATRRDRLLKIAERAMPALSEDIRDQLVYLWNRLKELH